MKKGCLIAVLIFIILAGAGVYFVGKVAKNVLAMAEEMEKLAVYIQEESSRLNNAFPFEQPEGFVIDDKRFEIFRSVRNSANETLTQTKLYNVFAENEFGFGDFMKFYDIIPESSRQVIESLVSQLDQNQMSFDEYSYINKLITGVVVSEIEDGNPAKIIPDDIVKKINDLNNSGSGDQDLFSFSREALDGMDQQARNEILSNIQPSLEELFGQTHMVYFDVFFFMFSSGNFTNVQ